MLKSNGITGNIIMVPVDDSDVTLWIWHGSIRLAISFIIDRILIMPGPQRLKWSSSYHSASYPKGQNTPTSLIITLKGKLGKDAFLYYLFQSLHCINVCLEL